MPLGALVPNVGKMTFIAFIIPMLDGAQLIVRRLTDPGETHRAPSPLWILVALMTCRQRYRARGNLTWTPVPKIIDVLDEALCLLFNEVHPTGLR